MPASARVWDADTDRDLDTGAAVYSVAFSLDGHRFASGGYIGAVRLWDTTASCGAWLSASTANR
jgi:hypothetical protein